MAVGGTEKDQVDDLLNELIPDDNDLKDVEDFVDALIDDETPPPVPPRNDVPPPVPPRDNADVPPRRESLPKTTPAKINPREALENKRKQQAEARAAQLAKAQEARNLAQEKAAQLAKTKQEAAAAAKEKAIQAAKAKQEALAAAKAKATETRIRTQTQTLVLQEAKLEFDLRAIEEAQAEGNIAPAKEKALQTQKTRLELELKKVQAQLEKLTDQADTLVGPEKRQELAESIEAEITEKFRQQMEKKLTVQVKPLILQAYNLAKQIKDDKPTPVQEKQGAALKTRILPIQHQFSALYGNEAMAKLDEILEDFKKEMEDKEAKAAARAPKKPDPKK